MDCLCREEGDSSLSRHSHEDKELQWLSCGGRLNLPSSKPTRSDYTAIFLQDTNKFTNQFHFCADSTQNSLFYRYKELSFLLLFFPMRLSFRVSFTAAGLTRIVIWILMPFHSISLFYALFPLFYQSNLQLYWFLLNFFLPQRFWSIFIYCHKSQYSRFFSTWFPCIKNL